MQRLLNHAVWDQDWAQGVGPAVLWSSSWVISRLRVAALDESGQEKHGC